MLLSIFFWFSAILVIFRWGHLLQRSLSIISTVSNFVSALLEHTFKCFKSRKAYFLLFKSTSTELIFCGGQLSFVFYCIWPLQWIKWARFAEFVKLYSKSTIRYAQPMYHIYWGFKLVACIKLILTSYTNQIWSMPEWPIVVARRCLGYKHSKSEAHFLLYVRSIALS